jgi:prolyl-tRNA editing enzyme YbaK/EbsC (Cys-tRNA(Pro) deacylase)
MPRNIHSLLSDLGICPVDIDTLLCRNYTGSNMITTQITQYLDSKNIPYRILPHSEPVFTVEMAAAQRGVVLEEMVKSILLRERRKHRFVMACVTGDSLLDPQAVRAHLPGEWKRFSFASGEEITTNTGYVKGAMAPLCLPEHIPVIFDNAIVHCAKVNISSGDPMAGLELASSDLARLSKAIIAPIAASKE